MNLRWLSSLVVIRGGVPVVRLRIFNKRERERINELGKELCDFILRSLSDADPHARDEFEFSYKSRLVTQRGGYEGWYSYEIALTVLYRGNDTIPTVEGDIVFEIQDFLKNQKRFLVCYKIKKKSL
jgi:hypothetical protein